MWKFLKILHFLMNVFFFTHFESVENVKILKKNSKIAKKFNKKSFSKIKCCFYLKYI